MGFQLIAYVHNLDGLFFSTDIVYGWVDGCLGGWADVLFDPAADDEAEITMTDCEWPNFN